MNPHYIAVFIGLCGAEDRRRFAIRNPQIGLFGSCASLNYMDLAKCVFVDRVISEVTHVHL